MADPVFPDVTKENLWSTYLKLKAPVEAEYRAAVAGPAGLKKRRQADVQQEYDHKYQQAKADLYQAQRRFKETTYTLKRWKDASLAAVDVEYRNAQQPASARRKERMAPIERWFAEKRKEFWERHDDQDGQA